MPKEGDFSSFYSSFHGKFLKEMMNYEWENELK
jgi:hypothetical protein